MSVIISSDV